MFKILIVLAALSTIVLSLLFIHVFVNLRVYLKKDDKGFYILLRRDAYNRIYDIWYNNTKVLRIWGHTPKDGQQELPY